MHTIERSDCLEIDFASFGHATDAKTGKLAGPCRSILLSTSLASNNPVLNFCQPLHNLGLHHQSGALIHHKLDVDALVLFPVYSSRVENEDYVIILRVSQVIVKFEDGAKPTPRTDVLIIKAREFAEYHSFILSNAIRLFSKLTPNTHQNSGTWCEEKLQIACKTRKSPKSKDERQHIFANSLINGQQLRVSRAAFGNLQEYIDTVSDTLTYLPKKTRASFSFAWGVDRHCDFLDISCVTAAASSRTLFLARTPPEVFSPEQKTKSKYISPVRLDNSFGNYCRAIRREALKDVKLATNVGFATKIHVSSEAVKTDEFLKDCMNTSVLSADRVEMILNNLPILHGMIQKVEESDKELIDTILASAMALHFGNPNERHLSSALLLSLMPTDDDGRRFHLQHEPYTLQLSFVTSIIEKAIQDPRITNKHKSDLLVSLTALQNYISRPNDQVEHNNQDRKTNIKETVLRQALAEIA